MSDRRGHRTRSRCATGRDREVAAQAAVADQHGEGRVTALTCLHVGTRVRSLVDDGMFVTVGLEGVVWQQFGPLIEWDNNTRSSVSPDEVEVIT